MMRQPRRKTQKERVLESLEVAGPKGVTQADWSGAYGPTPDGGPPITRLAARIADLMADGHLIARQGVRDQCRIYRMQAAEQAPEVLTEALFEVPVQEQLPDSGLPAIYREAA